MLTDTKPTAAQSCYEHPCLFDLEQDPLERTDLSKVHPDVLQQLTERLAWYNRTHVPDISDPLFDNSSCPKPPNFVWMPWREDGTD